MRIVRNTVATVAVVLALPLVWPQVVFTGVIETVGLFGLFGTVKVWLLVQVPPAETVTV